MGDHTETVALEFDPEKLSYDEIMQKFWSSHDPCIEHRNQYMAAIFYHDKAQKQLAEKTKTEQQKKHSSPIVTKILPAETFYNAEDYHQKYYLRQYPTLMESLAMSDEELITSPLACKLNGYVAGYGKLEDFKKDAESLGMTQKQKEYVEEQMRKRSRH